MGADVQYGSVTPSAAEEAHFQHGHKYEYGGGTPSGLPKLLRRLFSSVYLFHIFSTHLN